MIDKINILLNVAQKKRLITLLVLIFSASILEMIGVGAIPLFLGLLLDSSRFTEFFSNYSFFEKINSINYEYQIVYFGLILLIFFILKNCFIFYVNYFQSKLSKDLNVENAKKIFSYYINSSYSILLKKNPAIITRNISGDVINANVHLLSLVNLLREFLLILVIFILLIFVDFFSTLSIFVLMTIFVTFFYFFVRKKIIHLSILNQNLRGIQIKMINQIFGSFKETKIYSKEKVFEKFFGEATVGVEKVNFFNGVINKIPKLLIEIFFITGILLIIFFTIAEGNRIIDLIPTLTFMGVAVIRLIPAFGSITILMNSLKKTEVSFNLIVGEIKAFAKNLYLSPLKKYKNIDTKHEEKLSNLFDDSIKLENISYKYNDEDELTLNNINLSIKFGQKTAIIGRTGSGKTTLINLILGLLKPTNGKITFNDGDLEIILRFWHRNISIVPQDVYLLDDTIKNNIIFGVEEKSINTELFDQAIKKSRLENFIEKLPDKEQTVVGNQGIRLSGGQKQRIGIARAIYRNKKILIFDEATSSLDVETEKKLLNDIYTIKDKPTLIVVTHRLNTVANFDKIIVVENKNIKVLNSNKDKIENILI